MEQRRAESYHRSHKLLEKDLRGVCEEMTRSVKDVYIGNRSMELHNNESSTF
jgi:hypothetical protein